MEPQGLTFISDGCSWSPDLWIRQCCVEHDLGGSDLQFWQCIVEDSPFLGPAAYIFASIFVLIMILGRPFYNWIKHLKEKGEIKHNDKFNE